MPSYEVTEPEQAVAYQMSTHLIYTYLFQASDFVNNKRRIRTTALVLMPSKTSQQCQFPYFLFGQIPFYAKISFKKKIIIIIIKLKCLKCGN